MEVWKSLVIPVVVVVVVLVVGVTFTKLPPVNKSVGNYASAQEAIAASFR